MAHEEDWASFEWKDVQLMESAFHSIPIAHHVTYTHPSSHPVAHVQCKTHLSQLQANSPPLLPSTLPCKVVIWHLMHIPTLVDRHNQISTLK